MSRKSLSNLSTMLKMGLLCVGVLVALALTSPSPPLSDAASKQEMAANDLARAQLEQLKLEMAQENSNPTQGESSTAPSDEPEALDPEQERELKRIRDRLLLSQAPLNLVEEPEEAPLDDPALAALAELQAQASEQAKNVQPFIKQELEDKRAVLAAEEARLRLERQSMEQLKEEVEGRLAELKEVQKAVEEISGLEQKAEQAKAETKTTQEEQRAKVAQVSKVIAQMKPAPAAQVVERLTLDLAVEVMGNIAPRIAGKIMAALNPDVAAAIGRRMAKQDQLVQAMQNEAEANREINEAMQTAGQMAQAAAAANKPPEAATPPVSQQP